MTIKRTLFLGFFILIVIFIINFLIDYRLSSEVVTNSKYLSHSEDVIRNSNMLHKNMIAMQNSFRGYLLTGQESFLIPYNEGIISVPSLLKEQKKLLVAPIQMSRLDSIKLLHGHWIVYANGLINAKRDTVPEASKKYEELFEKKLRMEAGKKINDSIRNIFIDFDTYEYGIRQERRQRLRESIIRTRNISAGLTIFSITMAIALSIYVVNTIVQRIRKMTAFSEDISRGKFLQINDGKNDEFNILSISLNIMSSTLDANFKELTAKNKELDQFAYVVSHDLKAPLRGIDHIIRWIEEDHKSELSLEMQKKVELINGRVKRLEGMINGLLDYARIGRTKKSKTEISIDSLISGLIDLLVPENFAVIIASPLPNIIAERVLIEQVFANLISNAVKYNDKADGTIWISYNDLGHYYEFNIADNGPGILSEYYDKIFIMFQTLKERDAFESTGMGLAIVRKILDEMKTSIKVAPRNGGGTIFSFTWPKEQIN
ncbi:MAG: histidine kinase [Flavipsychrobacter sp.]|jgi:signal transduction histidine kinase|nr:histidine kinase [Flavipsychrobacter sp.]